MAYNTLNDLLLLKLQALYDVESEIIKALPKMAKKAENKQLKAAFEKHLVETKIQKERLEQIFEFIGEKPKKEKVEEIRGIIADGEWIAKQRMTAAAKDVALVAAAQYVEHYEMAGYGTARTWADLLQLDKVAKLLDKTLAEEKKTDETLNTLAEKSLNTQVPREVEEM